MKKNIFFLFSVFGLSFSLFAQVFLTPPLLAPVVDDGPFIVSRAAVLIDAHTGALLYSKNPDEEIPPASMTKLMTMHLVMKEINEGRASYDEFVPITVDSWAQSQPPRSSLMFLEPGQTVTLREIMLGLAVSSGNDAAVAAALRLAPTVPDFAGMMTAEARRMGMSVTRFVEPSGISAGNMTTAAEFALFSRQYIQQHPQSLRDFHSVQTFAYPLAANVAERNRLRPNTIVQNSQNSLLRTFPGVDGLKTGFINQSGYNIAITAERDQTRFILVIMGAPNIPRTGSRIRAADSASLLAWAFENFKTVRPEITEIENAPLWKGVENAVELKLAESPDFTAPINRAYSLKFDTVIPETLIAPLPEGFTAGYLSI